MIWQKMLRSVLKVVLILLFINIGIDYVNPHTDDEDATTEEIPQTQVSHCYRNNRESLTLVSTLDGRFVALDSNSGKIIWSLKESSGPLLSSSLSSVKHEEDRMKLRYVPSLSGGIFQIEKDKIEAVPFSADILLGKFQKLPDGTDIVGGKDIKSFGIDAETGNVLYECNINGCKPVANRWHLSERDIFVIRRTQKVVRAVDLKTGEERWNFSVGNFDVSYLDSPGHQQSCEKYSENSNLKMKFNVAKGLLEAFRQNSETDVEWSFRFDSPIADVWKLDNKVIKPVDILRYGLLKDMMDNEISREPILYLGVYEGQMYAQSLQFNMPQRLPKDPSLDHEGASNSNEVSLFGQPYLGTWRPYIGSSPSRTPSLMNKNGLTVWNQLDYPFDNGFCMIALKRITALKKLEKKEQPEKTNKSVIEDPYTYDFVPVSLFERWREILLLAVLISIFLQYTIFKFIRRRYKMLEETQEDDLPKEGEIKRVRSVTASVSTSTDPPQESLENVIQTIASINDFSSRYLVDFDHIECIGKGGFGVVFKARNKIDDCEYAVKRIYLPNCNEAKEKVTREVKALAQLDYPGIVRFFYSWWESPPTGWQETIDRNHLMSNIPGAPVIGLSKEWYIHIQTDEEDTFDEEDSGLTLKRRRNKSTKSSNSMTSSKSIGDDPFGRRSFNDSFGIDDAELLKVDLLKNNDVFHEETSQDDSFNIEFKNENHTDNGFVDSSEEEKEIEDISIEFNDDSSTGLDFSRSKSDKGTQSVANVGSSKGKLLKSRLSTKLVGRCCCKSEECIRAPPLYLYIQMQLCMSSTLKDWLNENITERQRKYIMGIFEQILRAVEYCHRQGMMHRDLKPSNIFFAKDGSIKIGDFGLVTAITRPSEGKGVGQPAIDENHTGNVGTQLYMSPEQIKGDSYNHKVDIYALGLILFELLVPFSTQMERIKSLFEVKQHTLPNRFEEKYSTEAKILRWLLSEDPDGRPEATDFRRSELFKNICIDTDFSAD
ncbi:eukaryotic translation initiation factor 2-alpha kinase 3-like [Rhopilema esculentum]|uniref:eukaryotic translation initiation factor 2-alpha kinase 3-like n=1 Tax=Rhopilema esculentum TaxID=499914 RepID=UPI0031CF1909